MAEFTIPDKPCKWCSRFVGHFDWCPEDWTFCICQTSVVPSHRYGMHPRCLYVADALYSPDRPWRGIFPGENGDMKGADIASCHWPNPVVPKVMMRTPECAHGTHPWSYAS